MTKNQQAVHVTKTFLPPFEEYNSYLKKIWDSNILTNQGSYVRELEAKLQNYLQCEHIHCLANGTLSLQLALSALKINDGEIITTPFSYVATISSILWQRCKPVFVDIKRDDFTLDPEKIEQAITKNTKAILAVHVFGYPCDIEMIQTLADRYNLKIIYDAAHSFGVQYKNKALASYGDISILSFHATKLFHTVEGGACIIKDKKISDTLELQKRFGHDQDYHYMLGTNAKMSELHAIMGLANLPYVEENILKRKTISDTYSTELADCLLMPTRQKHTKYNYAYYPILFKNEKELLRVFSALAKINIFPRRYFYPSLNTLPYVGNVPCPLSEDISRRIACLPLFVGLEENKILTLCECIKNELCK